MSVGVTNSQLLDLQNTTLANLPFDGQFETTLQNPKYHVINKWFAEDKIQLDGGEKITRNIQLDPQGNAQHIRPYAKVSSTVRNQQSKINADWVKVLTSYAISREEVTRNRGRARYIDMLKSKRRAAMVDLANLLELRAWSAPESSSDDLNPFGLPYWLNKVNASVSSTGDYIGQTIRYGNGSTSTTKGGIDGSTETHWRNWAFTYDAVNEDFLLRLTEAFLAADFQSPMIVEDMVKGALSNFRIYMPRKMLANYTRLTAKANENIGADLGRFNGVTSFQRVPIFHTPQINGDTDEPCYGVNHAHFFPYVMEGDWMRESQAIEPDDQPDVFITRLAGQYQYFADNVREAGFVASLVPTA